MSTVSKSSSAKSETQAQPQRVSSPKIKAQACESCGSTSTRVYKTEGRIRRCVCDHCGSTWKLSGPFADELREYALNFADSLRSSHREDIEGQKVLLITAALADDLEKTFRRLATT